MPSGKPQTQTSADAFKLQQFGGMLPAWDDHLISDGQASLAQNTYLFSGALAGWRTPKLLYTFLNSGTKFAYRLPIQTKGIATATLTFAGTDVNVGDAFTLGEETYTFVAALSGAAYEILIGATMLLSATNAFVALTYDSGSGVNAGVLYGIGTVANPAIDQTQPNNPNTLSTVPARINVYAPTFGAAYNGTIVGSNTTRLQWTYNNLSTTTFGGGTNVTFDGTITGPSTWIEFADPDTDVMRSPVVDDTFDRFYFASPSVQPTYNTRARIQSGLPAWQLGVPPPGCTPTVTVSGGGSSLQVGYPNVALGTTGTGAPGSNTIYLIPITPTGAIILNDVSWMPEFTSTTCHYQAVLYSDLNGSPHTLMNTGADVQGVTAGTTAASAFVNPTGLLLNVQYWIGIAMDQAIDVQVADNIGSNGVVSLNTYGNGPPGVITNLSTGYADLQVWGDCTSSSVQEARAYVYTYVSAYGEEGPPSPAGLLTGWSNGTWTIGLFQPPPDQLGITRNLVGIRLYRTITAQGGATTYYQVTPVGGDLPITQASYKDTITDDIVVNNTILSTQLYNPPPEDLQGLIAMPNGMAVGFRANEIWFCQPYLPHAWPASYTLTTEYPIVGLGVTGNSVVACTTGSPYIASGSDPAVMTALKIQHSEPCTSRGSILGNNDGVYYTSPNGLILVTQYGSVANTSELWITREKWQQLTPQKNTRAVFLVSSYFSLGCVRNGDNSVAQRGFTIELNSSDAQSFGIWPTPGGHRLGFAKLTGPNQLDVYNVRLDPWSAVCLVMQGTGVYYYDFSDPAPLMQTYKWRSKMFQQRSKKNLSALRIWFSIPAGTPAQNTVRNTAAYTDPSWNALAPGQYGILRVFAGYATNTFTGDSNPPLQLVMQREIWQPQELLRIPSGFKAETWQFEIEARVPIANVQVGTSVKALAQT